jgi:hypothetical protein
MAQRGVSMDVRVGEVLEIVPPAGAVDNRKITVTLEHKDGRRARLRITASEDVRIERQDRRLVTQP